MKVLITGGTGFIGSRLALRCLRGGDSVTVLGRERNPREAQNREMLEELGAEVAVSSVTSRESLPELLRGVDVVYHLAAAQHEANVPDSVFWDVNVAGTRNLLEASVEAGVKRFVHGSTIGVYGASLEGHINEQSSLRPDNIYGVTKLEGEKVVRSFADKLPVTVIRISETYGPGDFRLLKLFKGIARGIYFTIGRGENLHHLIYIDDLLDGFSLASTSPSAVGNVFVLAGKEPMTTNQMTAAIAAQFGKKAPAFHAPLFPFMALAVVAEGVCRPLRIQPPIHRRRMDFFRKSFVFSQENASKVLGFEPRVGFEQGVGKTIQWYEEMGYL